MKWIYLFSEHAKGLCIDCIRRKKKKTGHVHRVQHHRMWLQVPWQGLGGPASRRRQKKNALRLLDYSQKAASPTSPEMFHNFISSTILRHTDGTGSAARSKKRIYVASKWSSAVDIRFDSRIQMLRYHDSWQCQDSCQRYP